MKKEKGLENEEQEKKQHAKGLKKIRKSSGKLQKKIEKCHNKDDQDYKGIRYIESLFNKVNDDYYKPIKNLEFF